MLQQLQQLLLIVNLRKNYDGGSMRLSRAELEHHLQNSGMTFMTAENPSAQALTPNENATRNRQLEKDLSRLGAKFHRVRGRYGGNEESSYMIFHSDRVTPEVIEKLGAKYGQESVLHSVRGEHQLKYVSGPKAGMHHPGKGYTMSDDAPDYYSQARGVPKKFTAQLDFDRLERSEQSHRREFVIDTDEGPVKVLFDHHPQPVKIQK